VSGHNKGTVALVNALQSANALLGTQCKYEYKNSSGDEIANVNFYAVRPGSYPNSLK